MDLDVVYNAYGQRTPAERRQVSPPAPVESATWQPGELDFWVLERGEWWGGVRGSDGTQTWVRAADLHRTGDSRC